MRSLCSRDFFVFFMYFGMGVSLAIIGVCVAKHFHVFWHGGELSY